MFSLYYCMNLIKLLNYGEYRNYDKCSRLKRISSIEDNYFFYFMGVYLLSSVTLQRKTIILYCEENVWVKVRVFKRFFNLFVFGFLFTIIKKLRSFMKKKMFIEIRLCNLMTYLFNGHVKIIEIKLWDLMTYFLKAMPKSLKYTWWSLMYQF